MDKAEIEKLRGVCGEADRAALAVLYNAWVKKFNAYKADDGKANLAEWTAAEKALRAKVDELTAKYMGAGGAALANLSEVERFLKARGYKIAKSKLYQDAAKGLIKVNADKSVNESEALAYAVRFLKKIKGAEGDAEMDHLYREKAEAELEKIRSQNEKLRFELAQLHGNYMPRDQVITEFAVKWGAIEAAVRHLIRTRGRDWLYAAGADIKKHDMFQELVGAELDDLFNGLATIEELEITLAAEAA